MRHLYKVLLLLLILSGCTKKNVVKPTDSSSEDSLSSYLTLANDLNLPFQKKQQYNQKAFAIIVDQPNDSMNKVNLFRVANRYFNMNDWKGYKKAVLVVLENSKICPENGLRGCSGVVNPERLAEHLNQTDN